MSLLSRLRPLIAIACAVFPASVCQAQGTGVPERVVFNPADFPDEPFAPNEKFVTVATGLGHVEGPTWNPDAGGFIYNLSDRCGVRSEEKNCNIPDVHWFWRPGEAKVQPYWSVTKDGKGGTNHGAIWSEGLIYLTNRGPGRIGIIDPTKDPMVETVLTANSPYKLGRPNDLDRFKDGSLYFSDGPGGIGGVHRVHMDGRLEKVISAEGNGIAFTHDCKTLWVAASGIDAYDVDDNGKLSNKRDPISSGSNGIAVDIKGNVYTNNNGLSVFNPSGKKIAELDPPGAVGHTVNMTFGGVDHRWLLLTHGNGVSAIRTQIPGGECLGLGTQRPGRQDHTGLTGGDRRIRPETFSVFSVGVSSIRITFPWQEAEKMDARLLITDAQGKSVQVVPMRGVTIGTHTIKLEQQLSGGLYFVHFQSKKYAATVKYIPAR